MSYRYFFKYNVIGGISWVMIMFGIGYFFGNVSFVKSHFSLVVVDIVLISVIPAIVAFIRNRIKKAGGIALSHDFAV